MTTVKITAGNPADQAMAALSELSPAMTGADVEAVYEAIKLIAMIINKYDK